MWKQGLGFNNTGDLFPSHISINCKSCNPIELVHTVGNVCGSIQSCLCDRGGHSQRMKPQVRIWLKNSVNNIRHYPLNNLLLWGASPIWRIYMPSSITFTYSLCFLQISRIASEVIEHFKLPELVIFCIPLGISSKALALTVWKVHRVLRFDKHFRSEHWSSILSCCPIYLEWPTCTSGWMDGMSWLLIDLGKKNTP